MEISIRGVEDVQSTISAIESSMNSRTISHPTLRIIDCRIFDKGMATLVDFLSSLDHTSLGKKTLEITHCRITDVSLLKKVKWIHTLQLIDDSYEEDSIADLLEDNETLLELEIHIGTEMLNFNTDPISQALAYNTTLKTLILPASKVDDIGVALSMNTTLESLIISPQMWALRDLSYFTECFQSNWTLTYLDLGWFWGVASEEDLSLIYDRLEDAFSNKGKRVCSLFDFLSEWLDLAE